MATSPTPADIYATPPKKTPAKSSSSQPVSVGNITLPPLPASIASTRKQVDELEAETTALQLDMRRAETQINEMMAESSVAKKSETDLLKRVALDAGNRELREALDTTRGKLMVLAERVDAEYGLNTARRELIDQNVRKIESLEHSVKQGQDAYLRRLYDVNQAELRAKLMPLLYDLAALSFMATRGPVNIERLLWQDDKMAHLGKVDGVSAQVRAKMMQELKRNG